MGKLAVIKKATRAAWKSPLGTRIKTEYLPKLEATARDALMKSIRDFGGARGRRRARRRQLTTLTGKAAAVLSIGENIGYGTLKRHAIQSDNQTFGYNAAQMYSKILTGIPRQTAAEEANMRDGSVIDFTGIRLQWTILNLTPSIITMNIACIVPKHLALTDTSVPVEEFFRGEGTGRSLNFSTDLSSCVLRDRAINIDLYDIIGRWKLNFHANAGDGQSRGGNVKRFMKYIPIRRQIRYTADGKTAGDDPFMVWWWDKVDRTGGVLPSTGGVSMEQNTTVFFKDVHC